MTSAERSSFVYVTFIRATPERVWAALTSPELMKQYWFGMTQDCDWTVGAPWRLLFPDGRVGDTGEILESDRPRRLVIRWRNEFRPELKAEGHGRCIYDIEPADGVVKLTITHSMDREGSRLIEAVSSGWPRILSNLKSLLETGEAVLAA